MSAQDMSASIRIEDVDAVDMRVEAFDWPFARTEAARIAAHWAARAAERPAMYDGEVLLQHEGRMVVEDGRRVWRGAAFVTRFSAFLAWRDFGAPGLAVTNIFSMAALRATDGAFLLGIMGAHTANAGRIYFPAGTPDRDDIVDGRLDLEGSALRELEEETGLGPNEVRVEPGFTLVFEGPRLACMKRMAIDGPADAIAARVAARLASEADPELAGLHIVRSAAELDAARMQPFTIAYLRARFSS